MALTDVLHEVHNRRSRISLGFNSKWCVDGSEWSEQKKQTNAISLECKRHNVSRAMNYFKYTFPSNITLTQTGKPLGHKFYFISIVRSSGSILDPYIPQVHHVKIQALITDHLISKRWEKFYSYYLEYNLPQE